MINIRRNLSSELLEWKEASARSPIILRGARQVGKTFLVKDFAKKHFKNIAYANFELQPQLANCFTNLDPARITRALQLQLDVDIIPGETLLFLDEIQECPEAITALRYFKEEMQDLHVISAGSLLEFVLNDQNFSMPVGRVQYMYIRPLSFTEFLHAIGKDRLLAYIQRTNLNDEYNPNIHSQLLEHFQEYVGLGGMPAVIAEFLANNQLNTCDNMLSDLLISYRDDFSKYAKTTDHKYLQKLYDKAPYLVSQWFKYVKVDPDMDARGIKRALELLDNSGVISRVLASTGSGLPLASTQIDKKFKLLFLDIGLLRAAQQINLSLIYQKDQNLMTKGQLAEQVVGQELLAYAPKIQRNKLFFWQREEKNSQAEVDYLYVHDGLIIPLEVKAGKVGRLKSLKIFMQEKQAKTGIRISELPLSYESNILSVPFYMISEMPRLLDQCLTK